MSAFDIWTVMQSYGPIVGPAVLVFIFFLWKDFRREMKLQSRIEALEKEQKETIVSLVEKCTEAISQNTMMMHRLETVVSRCSMVAKNEQRSALERLIDDAQ